MVEERFWLELRLTRVQPPGDIRDLPRVAGIEAAVTARPFESSNSRRPSWPHFHWEATRTAE